MEATDASDSQSPYDLLADELERGDTGHPTHRHLLRGGLAMLTALFAMYVLLPQLAHFDRTINALHNAQVPWLLATAAISASTYCSAAIALTGAAGLRLPFILTWKAQVAAAFESIPLV